MYYAFTCSNNHVSYSASKEQRDPSCPTCHEPTQEITFRIHSVRTGKVVIDSVRLVDTESWVDETHTRDERRPYLLTFIVGETRKSGENTIERLS